MGSPQIVPDLPPSAARIADLIGLLGVAAENAARAAGRATFRASDQRAKGKRLPDAASLGAADAPRPTPLWNVFAAELDRALKKPGSRARLARYLGMPRQRITDFTKGRRLPDAETTLRLLHWLAAVEAGRDPSYLVQPPLPEATSSSESVTQ